MATERAAATEKTNGYRMISTTAGLAFLTPRYPLLQMILLSTKTLPFKYLFQQKILTHTVSRSLLNATRLKNKIRIKSVVRFKRVFNYEKE